MRKLTKKALSLVLSLLLVISAISGALSISAETVVNAAPLNIDFSDGLNHWNTTNNVEVKDGGITFTEGRAAWHYLTSENFTLQNLAVGDKVILNAKVSITDIEKATTGTQHTSARICFDTFNPDGSQINTDIFGTTYNTTASGLFSVNTKTEVVLSTERIVVDPNQYFNIKIAKGDAIPGPYTFSDIKVTVVKDTGASYVYTGAETPEEVFLNLDFSKGLNFWKNTDNIAVNNGAFTFAEGRAPWVAFETNEFKLPNLEVGDKVSFIRTVTPDLTLSAADTGTTERIRTIFKTTLSDGTPEQKFEYINSAITTPVTKETVLDVKDVNQKFSIQIFKANGTAGAYAVSDIKIVVTKPDGITYIYTNSTTPAVGYFDGNVAGGTEADGYTTTSVGAVLKYPTLSAPTNFDFKEGLKYWAPYREKNTTATSTSTYASVDENGILTLKRIDDAQWKQGITSQKFTVSNVAVGDKIRFIFEYDFDDENGKIRDFNFRVDRYTKDAPQTSLTIKTLPCTNNTNYFDKAPGEMSDTGWRTYFADHIVVDANDAYAMSLFYACSATITDADCATKFRNLRVVKVLSDGAYLDLATNEKISADFQPFGGTEEDGIVNKPYIGTYSDYGLSSRDKKIKELFGTNTNLVNGDFSQGFKYWFGGSYTESAPNCLGLSDYATVDKETGIVKFSVAENGYAPGLYSLPFYIKNLKANDILMAAVDVRNAPSTNSIQVNLGELTNNSSPAYYSLQGAEALGGYFAAPSETEWTTVWGEQLTVVDPAHPFFIRINKAAADAAEFKNVRLYKVDAATGEITIVNNGYNADNNFNKDGGSAENGMLELGSYVKNTPASNKLNVDFASQGLKYWAPNGKGFASDIAKVEENGSLTITAGAAGDALVSAPITFSEEYVGKKVTLWMYVNHLGTPFDRLCYDENDTLVYREAKGMSGWHAIEIPEVAAGSKYRFMLKLPGTGAVNVEKLNLVVALEHEIGADSYFDLDGNELMGPGLNFQPIGGTEENGIISSSNGTGLPVSGAWHLTSEHMPANDGLANADFSEGFKYWVYKTKGEIISDNLALDKETGVVSYKESDNTLWSGLYSQVFTLKNSGIKKDDVLYAAIDVSNTPSSMTVNLHSHYYNGEKWVPNTKNGDASGSISAERWATIYSGGMTVEDVNTLFYVDIQKGYEDGQGSFKNVRMLRKDRGKLKETVVEDDMTEIKDVLVRVNVDGSLLDTQVYGDANYDGKIDLLDLVRMKKFAAGDKDGNGIFLAAVDADKDDVVEADDFSAVVAWLFEAKK